MTVESAGRPVQAELAGMPPRLYAASPSRLLAHVDCPRRYRMQYLDRPRPPQRSQRAHTSFGLAVHNALRDWWDLPRERRTADAGRELVRTSWIDVGFRDPEQSARWRRRAQDHVSAYLSGVDADDQPTGIERTVAFVSGTLRVTGRIDRLDDRDGELVVVDYKTSRKPLGTDDARTSLPMALYAAAVWKMFRRPCLRVELHHVPSGEVLTHTHTPESLTRKVDEAKSIARDAQRADADFAERGVESTLFPPVVGPLCTWCDFRAHCPEGQAAGPEKSGWAALEDEGAPRPVEVDRGDARSARSH
ncbi:RecB family exonuclease [Knoellia aerolata]|uniref:RecB family exonuclease n=1 Tax=Knoellia aerolata DSM 18566 TaxID=1385519 RepID=A0A0A0JVK7_9MICO|nr:PD-(D/E)XK nuclease family protein [Knoellia aerolata]KGN40082.1 RecB family exonuclease [Knoellia aerolata DSM 18566]